MNKLKFWQLSGITFVLWYIIIGFVLWESDWITRLQTMIPGDRLWFLLAVGVKFCIDYLIWKLLQNENKPIENQKTYLYDENGNENN